MDGMKLLARARAAGLQVRAVGGRLLVRGPRRHEALARELLAHKAAVLAALRDAPPPFWPLKVWQDEWGWVSLQDPFTGDVYQVRWRDCPQWLRRRAQEG